MVDLLVDDRQENGNNSGQNMNPINPIETESALDGAGSRCDDELIQVPNECKGTGEDTYGSGGQEIIVFVQVVQTKCNEGSDDVCYGPEQTIIIDHGNAPVSTCGHSNQGDISFVLRSCSMESDAKKSMTR